MMLLKMFRIETCGRPQALSSCRTQSAGPHILEALCRETPTCDVSEADGGSAERHQKRNGKNEVLPQAAAGPRPGAPLRAGPPGQVF